MPTPLIVDNANRANGAVGNGWLSSFGGGGFTISSNQFVPTTGSDDNTLRYGAANFEDDHYAEVTLGSPTPGDYSGPMVRASATDAVLMYYDFFGGSIAIEWYNGGSYTAIDSDTASLSAGDVLRLEAEGTTFRGYVNDVLVLSGTNGSAPSSGAAGMYCYHNSGALDNFEGGNLADGIAEVLIRQGSDDAFESTAGAVALTNGFDLVDHVDEWFGWRFQQVFIPSGMTITSAYLSVTIGNASLDAPDLTIYAEDSDNAAAFAATSNNLSGRSRTTATVAWDSADLGATTLGRVNTPDLSSLVQEVIDRGGWSSGNAMAFVANGDTPTRDIQLAQYETGIQYRAYLHVEWTDAPAEGVEIAETLEADMTTADAQTTLAAATSWSPAAGDYLVALVGTRGADLIADNGDVGNGAAWVSLDAIEDTQNTICMNVYGYEVTSSFTGTPDIDFTQADDVAIQFIRLSPLTDGYRVLLDNDASDDVGGTDDASPTVSLSYTNADLVLGGVTHRDLGSHAFTQGASYTANVLGTTSATGGGEDASVSSEYSTSPGASPVTVDGSLASSHDWIIWAGAFYEAESPEVTTVTIDEYAQGQVAVDVAVTGEGTLDFKYEDQSDLDTWISVPVQHIDAESAGSKLAWLGGIPKNMSVKIRTDMNGDGNYVESSAFTTLDVASSFNGTRHYPSVLYPAFWSYPESGNRSTDATSDAAQYALYGDASVLAFDRNTSGLTFLDSVALESNAPEQIMMYVLFNEVRHDESTDGPDSEPVAETGSNHLIFDATAIAEFNAIAQSTGANYDEDIFLHSGSSHTPANRIEASDGAKWVMNPANATWRAFQRRQLIRLYTTFAGAGVTASRRFTAIAWDNVDTRPNRSSTTSDEYGTTGVSSTYRTDVKNQLSYLEDAGIPMFGNVIGALNSGGNQEVRDIMSAGALFGCMVEAGAGRGYSGYIDPADMLLNWVEVEYLLSQGYEVWFNGQITDTTTDPQDSGMNFQLNAVWAAAKLVEDTDRVLLFSRGADADSSGYDRLRVAPLSETDLGGDPLGSRTFDSGSGTTPDGIWEREYPDYWLLWNNSATSSTSTRTGGSLAAREVVLVTAAITVQGVATGTQDQTATSVATVTRQGVATASQGQTATSVATRTVQAVAEATQGQSATSAATVTRQAVATATQAQAAVSVATRTVQGVATASQAQTGTTVATISTTVQGVASASQDQVATSVATVTRQGTATGTQAQAATSVATRTVQGVAIASQGQTGTVVATTSGVEQGVATGTQGQTGTVVATVTRQGSAAASQDQSATTDATRTVQGVSSGSQDQTGTVEATTGTTVQGVASGTQGQVATVVATVIRQAQAADAQAQAAVTVATRTVRGVASGIQGQVATTVGTVAEPYVIGDVTLTESARSVALTEAVNTVTLVEEPSG